MPNAFNFAASPFDCLTPDEQRLVRASVDIAYFPEGAVVLDVGVVPTHLFVIIKGYVTQTEGDEVLATYGPDDCFDGCGLMTGRVGSRFVAAEELLDHLPALVDEEGGGRQAHVVEALGGLAAGIHRHLEGQRVVAGVVAHVVGRIVAHRDGEGLEALGGELVVGGHQLGHLGHAGGAGGGPEVHQHHLAAQRREAAALAVEGGEAHVRGGRLAAAADQCNEEERGQEARDSLEEHRFLTGKRGLPCVRF